MAFLGFLCDGFSRQLLRVIESTAVQKILHIFRQEIADRRRGLVPRRLQISKAGGERFGFLIGRKVARFVERADTYERVVFFG